MSTSGAEAIVERVACCDCGAAILPQTAERHAGRCAPCAKVASEPPPAYPSRQAFLFASGLLALNAVAALLVGALGMGWGLIQVGGAIDLALAVGLLFGNDNARLIVIVRAVIGLVAITLSFLLSNSAPLGGVQYAVQLLYSGALVALLTGNTAAWRLLLGYAACVMLAFFVLFNTAVLVGWFG